MSYKVSIETIKTLKDFAKGEKLSPLKEQKDVEELLLGYSFILMMASAAKKKGDEKAEEAYQQLEKALEEISLHKKDIDLMQFNEDYSNL